MHDKLCAPAKAFGHDFVRGPLGECGGASACFFFLKYTFKDFTVRSQYVLQSLYNVAWVFMCQANTCILNSESVHTRVHYIITISSLGIS